MTQKYDFSDEAVREMVFLSHRPVETSVTTRGHVLAEGIVCRACHQDWPCKAIQGLRNYTKKEQT